MHRSPRGPRKRAAALALFAAGALLVAAATLADAASDLQDAQAALQAGDNARAAELFRAVTAAQPENAPAWNGLGTALLNLSRDDEAIAAWTKAEQFATAKAFVRYNLACAEARAGRPGAALDWLSGSVEAGFGNVQQLRTDPDLVSLRDDPRFAGIVERADRNARPCVYDPRARQFDFWVGSWNVFSPQGRQVGTNRIELALNGCMLTESWQGAAGGAGRSINYFDVETGEWVQHWVDASGGHIQLRGALSDGAMRLAGKNFTRGQATEAIRGTWTPLDDGRVRQLFEQSRDGGETWYVWFDGYYVPAEPPADADGS